MWSMNVILQNIGVWVDKHVYDEAEKLYYEKMAKNQPKKVSLAGEVAKARERIKQSLENVDDLTISNSSTSSNAAVQSKIDSVVEKVALLRKEFEQLKISFISLEKVVKDIDNKLSNSSTAQVQLMKQSRNLNNSECIKNKDDDDVDLFGSESENEDEKSKEIEKHRLAEFAAKKSKKPSIVAKSSIIFDVKPWDDETNMEELEKCVRLIQMDGLVWGSSKLMPLAYGIQKLQISCVVEDDKVSVDELHEIIENSDLVQSVDIVAFNKV